MRERAGLDHELSTLLGHRDARSGPEHEIIGLHPRVQVTDTLLTPYRWICYLDITYLDPGERYAERRQAGTGVLISPRHVLTAAHNLLSEDGRLKTRSVVVTPGRNGSKEPFGAFHAKKWHIHPSWVRNGRADRAFDYALITLDDPIGTRTYKALGNRPLGHWGDTTSGSGTTRAVVPTTGLGGTTINVAGYPGDKPAGTLWRGEGTLRGPFAPGRTGEIAPADRLVLHTADTHQGQSGAPVWVYHARPLRRLLVGIHVAPAAAFTIDASGAQRVSHNLAVRLGADMSRQLDAWM